MVWNKVGVNMLVIGLTGNIGCGKSSLSQIFAQQNIKIIDADIMMKNY